MNNWTKGEWRVEKRYGHSDGERPVITSDNEFVDRIAIVSYHGVRTIKEADANALLISAAPDLLEACKGLMEKADNGSADFDDPEPGSIYLKAKDAIAKAQPKQSGEVK